MAIVYTQSQIDAAVNYLMTGGPNGGELTDDQYRYEAKRRGFLFSGVFCIMTDFCLMIQCAINQGHAGLQNSHNIGRDGWGAVSDAFQADNYSNSTGIAGNFVKRLGVIVSG